MLLTGTIPQDTKTLTLNKEHKNFTETDTIIPSGTTVQGECKSVEGLRRGEPFTYRIFVTQEGQIIYQNKITNLMPVTEIKLGADNSQTPTVVNFVPTETFSKVKLMGVVLGGLAGFAYAKYKKHDLKNSAMFIGIGAAAGFATAYVIDTKKKTVVNPSK